MSDVTLRDVLQYLAEERKLDFRGYKASSLERRFRHRMFQVKIGDYGDYLERLRNHPEEVNDLLNTVLINVTHFFRDPQGWEVLRQEVIPDVAGQLRPGDSFRAWSAGCATGEEAYSLAILLCDYFGERMKNYDLRVYATDVDEAALNIARKGEYSSDKLRQVPPEWRESYFQGNELCRVNREVRRLCIFGRANLASDAPISHVHLLLCRNVLIYFDSALQMQTLKRLHYALEPGGVLMLGKAETQLTQNALFSPVNTRWRIFRRGEVEEGRGAEGCTQTMREEELLARNRQDYALLKTYQDAILATVEPAVMLLDRDDTVLTENESALRLFGVKEQPSVGKRISESAVAARCPDLLPRLDALHKSGEPIAEFECNIPNDGGERLLRVRLRTISTAAGARAGTLVYADDITSQQALQHTIEELETTSEELQSSNEELETTNEELQSTNEELETTNEELQSTNEELETTNEELQALNEELGTTNEELEVRTRELDETNARYAETLSKMPWPVLLVDSRQVVQFWNVAIQKLFGLPDKSVIGLELKQLPLPEKLRTVITRRCSEAVHRHRDVVIRGQELDMNSFRGQVSIRFTPLGVEGPGGSVLIIVEAMRSDGSERPVAKSQHATKRRSKTGASKAKKRR